MSYIHQINKFDIENDFNKGPVVSVFYNFCSFHCKNCWNESTWNRRGDLYIENDILVKLIVENLNELKSMKMKPCLSLLGGDPIVNENIDDTYYVIKKVKEKIPDVIIGIWTGFEINHKKFEENKKRVELLKDIDILIDGQFIEKLKTKNQMFGSYNQRVINTKKYYETQDVKNSLESDYLNSSVYSIHLNKTFKISDLIKRDEGKKQFYWLNLINVK